MTNVAMKYDSHSSPGIYCFVYSGSKDNGSFTVMPLYFSDSFMTLLLWEIKSTHT